MQRYVLSCYCLICINLTYISLFKTEVAEKQAEKMVIERVS